MFDDGRAFEREYDAEVRCFALANAGVPGDDVEAALLLRQAGKTILLKMLHDGVIHVEGNVDIDEDTVADLRFVAA